MYSTEEILQKIALARARTNTREDNFFSQNPREVSKEKKIKRQNNISRSSEEMPPLEVSSETYLLASKPSDVDFVSVSPLGETSKPQSAFVSNIAPASTSSRSVTGITAQHARTKTGIKISLNIQTANDVATGEYAKITAELKRHDRLRELKRYDGDSPEFEEHYINTIQSVKELKPKEGAKFCIGRTHARGSRSAWIANVMVLGELNEQDVISRIFFYYNNEEYVIDFDQELSPRQQELYHSCGILGEIKRAQTAPTLNTIKKDIWK